MLDVGVLVAVLWRRYASIARISRLVLYGEIMALYCWDHVKRIDSMGQIQNFSIKYGGSALPTRH